MKFSLRELIQRIAWKKAIIIVGSCFLAYQIFTHNISCKLKVPSLRLPNISFIPQHTNDPVFNAVTLAMILITIIASVNLLTRQRDE
jgi:hypothetical protein